MSINRLLSFWRSDPTVGGNIVEWNQIPAKTAVLKPYPNGLDPDIISALGSQNITSLYSHQAEAWDLIQKDSNVVIVTGTASGKTLAYNLPVLDRLGKASEARALYLFPTKALAHDQVNELDDLMGVMPRAKRVAVRAYDGDTPQSARPKVRRNARIILSNPDMLHAGILPHHTRWEDFFRNLNFVVIDEIHTYRGVFGSHVGNVLRRLKRIANFYGSSPRFILTSATIGNPTELAEKLIEEKVELVDQDGAPRGPKHFLLYNPPVIDEDLGIRRSVMQESVRLTNDLVSYGVQTILFGRARRSVEVMLNYLREGSDLPDGSLRGYRSGYLPTERREIENGLRTGKVRAVVATNALELGIDIGGMDAAVLSGYPGSIAASWQQAGRAGRKLDPSLAIMAASANPLDQFLVKHPDFFFDSSPEQALINPDNLLILLGHIRCAAFELPFQTGEGFGKILKDEVAEYMQLLEERQEIHQSKGKYFWTSSDYPSQGISLRSASPNTVTLHAQSEDGWKLIGDVDSASADWLVHPESIYIHEGRNYVVDELDLEQHIAYLRPARVDYFTQPRRTSKVVMDNELNHSEIKGGEKGYGELTVIGKVTGYMKVEWHTHRNLGMGLLDMPEHELNTTGYWFSLNDDTIEKLEDEGLWNSSPNQYGPNWDQIRNKARERDSYRCQMCGNAENEKEHSVHHKIPFRSFTNINEAHNSKNLITLCESCHRLAESVVRVRTGLSGLAFTLGHLAPLFLMCATSDIGVHSDAQSPLVEGKPIIVIYDHIPAGIGFSERLYEIHDEMIRRAYELVSSCTCQDGCPSCVGPGGEDGTGGKQEALALLKILSGIEDQD